jgi:hypothetical protein
VLALLELPELALGVGAAAAARGTAAPSTVAKAAVLAAIMSSSVCTGVASSLTPLA